MLALTVYKFSYIKAFRYESYTNMHVQLFFVVVQKGCCLPTSYQNIGIVSVFPTCLFHASKHFGKRVTQTCMPYCNVWAEVVYCGFPKSKVFIKTLIIMPIPCASPKSISPPSFICGRTPVSEIREFNQKKKKNNNSEKGFFKNLTPFP